LDRDDADFLPEPIRARFVELIKRLDEQHGRSAPQ
jgi:hypothetical protein